MAWYNPLTWTAGSTIDINRDAGRMRNAGEIYDQAGQLLDQSRNRVAPQAQGARVGQVATLGGGPQAQGRDVQMQLANRLLGIGNGQQMGAGEMAVNRQANQSLAANQAAARMSRGSAGGMGGLMAARQAGNLRLDAAGQAAQAASGDQMQALGQAGQVATGMRGQDIGIGQFNADAQNQRTFQQAGMDQQTGLANQAAQLQMAGMNDQLALQSLAQRYNVSVAEMQGLLEREKLRMGNQGTPLLPSLIGGAAQVGAAYAKSGGGAAAASDRNLKKDTRRVSKSIDKMLDQLVPHSWRYKDEGAHGEGRRAGVMAQDLEKSEAGRRLIRERPDGKYVDVNAGISAALAAVARLNERVRSVEGKGK